MVQAEQKINVCYLISQSLPSIVDLWPELTKLSESEDFVQGSLCNVTPIVAVINIVGEVPSLQFFRCF